MRVSRVFKTSIIALVILGVFPPELLANEKKVTVAGIIGQRVVFNNGTDQGKLVGENLLIGGSVFLRVNKKSAVGLRVDYWNDRFDLNGTSQANTSARLSVYKIGFAVKYNIGNYLNHRLLFNVGSGLDYFRAHLTFRNPTLQVCDEQSVSYNNIGGSIFTELRYTLFNIWSELSLVRLVDGKTGDCSGVWDNVGRPNFYYHHFSGGIGISFNL